MDRSLYTAIENIDIKAGDLVGFIESGRMGLIANEKFRYEGEHDRYFDILVFSVGTGSVPAVYSICDLDFMIIDSKKSFNRYMKAVHAASRRRIENYESMYNDC